MKTDEERCLETQEAAYPHNRILHASESTCFTHSVTRSGQ